MRAKWNARRSVCALRAAASSSASAKQAAHAPETACKFKLGAVFAFWALVAFACTWRRLNALSPAAQTADGQRTACVGAQRPAVAFSVGAGRAAAGLLRCDRRVGLRI